MRIVLLASGDFASPTLRALAHPSSPHELVAVVTQPDRGSGRGRKTTPTPVKIEAGELGIEAVSVEDVNTAESVERLASYQADLGLVIAFGQKIGPAARATFRRDCVNLHASLLPKYRGAAPFQWAIINGEERTGVTVFRLVDRMDAGPIYTQRWTSVKPEERANELHDRLAAIGVDAVKATLEILENERDFEPAPQNDAEATRAPKLSKADGLIQFDLPVDELANRICGLWSWPGAKCGFQASAGGEVDPLTVAWARVADRRKPEEAPGVLDYRLYAAAADGYLEILEVQPAGRRVMAFADYVNGRHIQPGDRLVNAASLD